MQGEHQVAGECRLHRHIGRFRSRISPTMMISGSCRIRGAHSEEKSRLILWFTCIWLKAPSTISMGSSMVQTFTSAVASWRRGGVKRGGLARAGRPRHQNDAVALARHAMPARRSSSARPNCSKVLQHVRVEYPHHQFSPKRWAGWLAQFHLVTLGCACFQAAVLRPALSATSMRPRILMRLVTAAHTCWGNS